MKKVTSLAFGIFMVFQFFGISMLNFNEVNAAYTPGAESCANNTGKCYCGDDNNVNYCPSTYDKLEPEATMCENSLGGANDGISFCNCCKIKTITPTYTCLTNGGTCIPAGDNCPTGWQQKTSDTCSVSGSKCCVQGTTASPVTTPGTSGSTINFANPLAFNTVEGLLSSVMTGFQAIVVLFAMIFFIWGATGYIMSAGNEEKMKGAKNGMTAALIGMALGIAAPSLLKTIGMILGWGDDKMCSSITDATAKANCQATFAAAPTTAQIGLNVLEFLLGVVGVLGIIMFIVGGVMYFGAAADEENVKAAKRTIKYAIMGIALALGSMVIMRQIAALLT